jgi:hypothetical protein
MYNLYYFVVLIPVTNLITGKVVNKINGIYRIGPHNIDVISIIFGSLLGEKKER